MGSAGGGSGKTFSVESAPKVCVSSRTARLGGGGPARALHSFTTRIILPSGARLNAPSNAGALRMSVSVGASHRFLLNRIICCDRNQGAAVVIVLSSLTM